MRADVKSELQQLREFSWWFLPELNCCFCGKPLVERPAGMKFGHRRHPKISVRLTLHHKKQDRELNSFVELLPCHEFCHKSFHGSNRGKSEREDNTNGQKGQEVEERQVVKPEGGAHASPFTKDIEDDTA